jgi:hypothetical protein
MTSADISIKRINRQGRTLEDRTRLARMIAAIERIDFTPLLFRLTGTKNKSANGTRKRAAAFVVLAAALLTLPLLVRLHANLTSGTPSRD